MYKKTVEFECKSIMKLTYGYLIDAVTCSIVVKSKCLNEHHQVLDDRALYSIAEVVKATWSGAVFIHKKELDDRPELQTELLSVIPTLLPPTREYLAKELYDDVEGELDKADKSNGLGLVSTRVSVAGISAEYGEEG